MRTDSSSDPAKAHHGRRLATIVTSLTLLAVGCAGGGDGEAPPPTALASTSFACDPDNGGLQLPDGFCAVVFAEGLGAPRHLAVGDTGDVYVAREQPPRRRGEETPTTGLTLLQDTDGDGRADRVEEFGTIPGSGVALHDGHLFFSSRTTVYRVALTPGQAVPDGEPEIIVDGFPQQAQHATKPLAFDGAGNLYVTVGAPSNACQSEARTQGSPGLDPCPQLELQGGIWRFDAARPGQTQADGERYATGIRNAFAIDWNAEVGSLYALQHGRDQLAYLFPDLYDQQASAELPAEEFLRVAEGDDFGWPYCYHDHLQGAKVLAPEYGGDATTVGRCADTVEPIVAFPGHWAPNDVLFYRDGTFPDRYDNGAFVAFHGSWNRAPLGQQGYNVAFVPFRAGAPAGDYEIFADGFAQTDVIESPGDARHRPTGLAQGPDGSLYVSDDRNGTIWRIVYRGED